MLDRPSQKPKPKLDEIEIKPDEITLEKYLAVSKEILDVELAKLSQEEREIVDKHFATSTAHEEQLRQLKEIYRPPQEAELTSEHRMILYLIERHASGPFRSEPGDTNSEFRDILEEEALKKKKSLITRDTPLDNLLSTSTSEQEDAARLSSLEKDMELDGKVKSKPKEMTQLERIRSSHANGINAELEKAVLSNEEKALVLEYFTSLDDRSKDLLKETIHVYDEDAEMTTSDVILAYHRLTLSVNNKSNRRHLGQPNWKPVNMFTMVLEAQRTKKARNAGADSEGRSELFLGLEASLGEDDYILSQLEKQATE